MDAKYSLINRKIYQTISIINFKEIKNWIQVKISFRWVNVNFQVQGDNRDAKNFLYNFIKLMDYENKEIQFEDIEKNISIVNFLPEFLT